jgi:hypothetical protein
MERHHHFMALIKAPCTRCCHVGATFSFRASVDKAGLQNLC